MGGKEPTSQKSQGRSLRDPKLPSAWQAPPAGTRVHADFLTPAASHFQASACSTENQAGLSSLSQPPAAGCRARSLPR